MITLPSSQPLPSSHISVAVSFSPEQHGKEETGAQVQQNTTLMLLHRSTTRVAFIKPLTHNTQNTLHLIHQHKGFNGRVKVFSSSTATYRPLIASPHGTQERAKGLTNSSPKPPEGGISGTRGSVLLEGRISGSRGVTAVPSRCFVSPSWCLIFGAMGKAFLRFDDFRRTKKAVL